MLVKMLSTRNGSPDGLTKVIYTEGKSYEVSGDLLDVFLREGWCEAAEPFREGKNHGTASGTAAEGHRAAEGPQENASEGTKEAKLVVAEAEILAKYTRDELLDLAEQQGIEVPSDVVKKADVVKFLAGQLLVTVGA